MTRTVLGIALIAASVCLMAPVPTSADESDAEARRTRRSERREDVRILTRIMDKRIKKTRYGKRSGGLAGVYRARGYHITSGRGTGTYLSGYGVVIDFRVPLAAKKKAEKPKTEKPSKKQDPEWEQARRELQGRTAPVTTSKLLADGAQARLRRGELVGLVRDVLQRHAHRMRHLRGEDWVAVRVFDAEAETPASIWAYDSAAKELGKAEAFLADGRLTRTKKKKKAEVDPILVRIRFKDLQAAAKGELKGDALTKKFDVRTAED